MKCVENLFPDVLFCLFEEAQDLPMFERARNSSRFGDVMVHVFAWFESLRS